MSKKRKVRDRPKQRGAKARYTNKANLYYKEVIAPLEKAFKRAMIGERFQEARDIFLKIRKSKKSHRQILMRKELVRIK